MENVILTPHMSADAPILTRLAVDLFCENIGRYLSGQPLRNQMQH
jgi:phosphoglycerate dehydrogenase-like enzyme